ncbi:MAG: hypothetical protein AAFV53_20425 [Myxococcota bacterium]
MQRRYRGMFRLRRNLRPDAVQEILAYQIPDGVLFEYTTADGQPLTQMVRTRDPDDISAAFSRLRLGAGSVRHDDYDLEDPDH